MIPIPTDTGQWVGEDLETNTQGDLLDPAYLNSLDAEIGNLLAAAGIERSTATNQILLAVKALASSDATDKVAALKKLLGGNDLFAPTATNGQQAGDVAYKANLNDFVTPGKYGVWNPSTTEDQIKGYWIVEVAVSGDQIVQICTSHLGDIYHYIRRRQGGTWTEERVVTETMLTSALTAQIASAAFTAKVNDLLRIHDGKVVGQISWFSTETDAEVLRTVDGLLLWLRCDGRTFSATDYPLLAAKYPSLTTPSGLDDESTETVDSGEGSTTNTTTTGYAFVRALDVA